MKIFLRRRFKCDTCGRKVTVKHIHLLKRYDVDRRTIIDTRECDLCRVLRTRL